MMEPIELIQVTVFEMIALDMGLYSLLGPLSFSIIHNYVRILYTTASSSLAIILAMK